MSLAIGTKLGPYEILAPIGAGGMGEVYRARDTKLKRDVALKVLPEAFARDPERMARFQREAEVLASLNHPNIAAIYGVEDRALVMELVEGATLLENIRKGPLPFDEAWKIASQIADALEYAHDKGIIHRDLKPANVKITPEGVVKLLDFGLAKAFTNQREPSASPENSPTLTMGATEVGVILGTAAYMPPEQARGKTVDKRADIWSFGVVLYEMLTGGRLFDGETVTDILAAVVTREPDWSRVPAKAQRLLRSCLEREPKKRLRDIGDVWKLLEAPASETASFGTRKLPFVWLWPSVAGLTALAAAGLAGYFLTRPAAPVFRTQFSVEAPENTVFGYVFAGAALSPDGRYLVFSASSGSAVPLLWLRALDSLVARPLPGTDGANLPFWSPDSKSVAFFAGDKLKRVEIASGAPLLLCDAPEPAGSFGGAWNRDGVILFGASDGLHRVAASGGVPVLLTKVDTSREETGHASPQFLPNGKSFLYFVESSSPSTQGIYAASLARPQDRVLILKTNAKALYTPPAGARPGYLLWLRERSLLAQRFDAGKLRLEGDPSPLAEDIALNSSNYRAAFWTSDAGLLAYRTGKASGNAKLVWIGRDGKRLGDASPEDFYDSVRLSPDGKRAAIGRYDSTPQDDIWLLEFGRGAMTRFTFDPKRDANPVWSPDGRQIAFASNRSGVWQLYRKDSGGAGQEEQLTTGQNSKFPTDWSRDGRYLLYDESSSKTKDDLWALPLEGERKPILVLQTPFREGGGCFSPDGKWIAYTSDESGHPEVYVRAFPDTAPTGPGGKWQVSNGGGWMPRWRSDGKELFYLSPRSSDTFNDVYNKMMAASVRTTTITVEIETQRELFPVIVNTAAEFAYDVTADGKSFLLEEIANFTTAPRLTVVVHWQEGLKK